ncbi:MAG: type II toxin-antitoxin system VapC family toxin [Chloroflexi bacterium]|nr:type II toxin-antitoxin system VapC family toxin [Chloroflexota bacterium]
MATLRGHSGVNSFVTDTHALLWHLSNDSALSAQAGEKFRLADIGGGEIFIPSIVLVEVVFLAERQRVPSERIDRIANLSVVPGSHYHLVPLDMALIQTMRRIPREIVPEMPDRLIAATALLLGLPLITRDTRIAQLTTVECIW